MRPTISNLMQIVGRFGPSCSVASPPQLQIARAVFISTVVNWPAISHEHHARKDYYQEGDHAYSELNLIEAYRKALRIWAKWVDRNINSKKIQVFFWGYSTSHFSTYLPKMNVLESVLKEMKTPVACLNITRMTDYRKEGHPYVYRKKYLSQEERMTSDIY
eukprot:Gb_32205 [translate_table: standard]